MTIKHIDFGKSQRETARKFARLMNLSEKQSADILANPEPYLRDAHDRLGRAHLAVEEAQNALRPTFDSTPQDPSKFKPLDTMTITHSEYDRLKNAAELLSKIRV